MHDIFDHIHRPCPFCGKNGLHWNKRQICCDVCECDWSIEEIVDEWDKAVNQPRNRTLPTPLKDSVVEKEDRLTIMNWTQFMEKLEKES